MEFPCICAYVPKAVASTENESVNSTESEKESKAENEANISLLFKEELNFNELLRLAESNDSSQNCQLGPKVADTATATSSSTDLSTSASQVLAVEAQNWQLRRELDEVEESIKSLECSLREQWSRQQKISYELQQMHKEKTKLLENMQKKFAAHVNERNKLVQEITTARQANMLTLEAIKAAEDKNKLLKNERNETAACLYKATVELYKSRTLEETENQNNLSDFLSETESLSKSSTTTSLRSLTSNSTTESLAAETNETVCSTLESSNNSSSSSNSGSSTDYAPETSIELSEIELNTSLKLESEKKQRIFLEQKKNLNDIRLDLSFVDKEKLHNIDSAFSEATNLATQSSTTTIRIIDATTPNILE